MSSEPLGPRIDKVMKFLREEYDLFKNDEMLELTQKYKETIELMQDMITKMMEDSDWK